VAPLRFTPSSLARLSSRPCRSTPARSQPAQLFDSPARNVSRSSARTALETHRSTPTANALLKPRPMPECSHARPSHASIEAPSPDAERHRQREAEFLAKHVGGRRRKRLRLLQRRHGGLIERRIARRMGDAVRDEASLPIDREGDLYHALFAART